MQVDLPAKRFARIYNYRDSIEVILFKAQSEQSSQMNKWTNDSSSNAANNTSMQRVTWVIW